MANFKPATRKKSKLRMALCGPSGSGKSFTALRLAHALANGGRIAAIDSEAGSLSKYSGEVVDGITWNFDVAELTSVSPTAYSDAIYEASRAGYAALIIDSLSHAWQGHDGALELVSRKGGNSFTAWKDVTPLHNRMIDSIVRAPLHVIATMRTKMAYELVEDKNGKKVPEKIGMEPIQRAGMEYEFDVVGDLDLSHTLKISKSRCSAIDGAIANKPSGEFIKPVIDWLETGVGVEPEGKPPEPPSDRKTLDNGVKASTKAQRDAITDLMEKAGITPDQKAQAFATRGVSSLRSLTFEQAEEMRANLEQIWQATESNRIKHELGLDLVETSK